MRIIVLMSKMNIPTHKFHIYVKSLTNKNENDKINIQTLINSLTLKH